tara:strand:- start:4947 stop:7259 length:2313 start_codon:yes stop_codon:yes gene_type:complete
MSSRNVGQRALRVNDHRPLHGTGRYLDDIKHLDLLHAAIVRSPVAHGLLTSFDSPQSEEDSFVFGIKRLRSRIHAELPVLWSVGDQEQLSTPVADEHLRYVGQPIGVAVAGSRYLAEDAAEAVDFTIEELAPVVDIDQALAPTAPLLYPDSGTNVIATFEVGDTAEHNDAVFNAADRTLRTTLRVGRIHGLALEGRGIVVVPDPGGKLTIYTSTQTPHGVRDSICEVLGLRRNDVRVIAPDVGGAFGLKDHVYEDEIMVVIAALELGRPVKWVEDRFESLLTTTHARDEIHEVAVAFDDDGTLKGLRVEGRRNVGARLAVFGGGPLFTAFGLIPGPYRWESVHSVGQLVATNTMSTGAYRGFGQTQAALIRERAVDLVASELNVDPVQLRAMNMISVDELPYQTRTSIEYDNGDYLAALRRANDLITQSTASPNDGRVRGIGYCSYVQMAGIGPSDANEAIGLQIGGFESATVRVEPDGSVEVETGISPHGQGLETTIPQLVADELGVDPASITLIHGDTDTAPYSAYGTAASRSIAVGGGATVVAARRVAETIKTIAAEMLEAASADIVLDAGLATVAGTRVHVAIADVARRAWQGFRLPEGSNPGLVESFCYEPASATFSYATHACRVAVDTGTGVVDVEEYVVVHDCGTIVNPTIVEGQIHGGVAQGLGAALMEEVLHDDQGQPLSSTLLDYHVPTSASMPEVRIEHLEIPSPFTPGGMKGMGEGGTNGSYAAIVNAVCAALPEVDWTKLATPLSPNRIWEALNQQA